MGDRNSGIIDGVLTQANVATYLISGRFEAPRHGTFESAATVHS